MTCDHLRLPETLDDFSITRGPSVPSDGITTLNSTRVMVDPRHLTSTVLKDVFLSQTKDGVLRGPGPLHPHAVRTHDHGLTHLNRRQTIRPFLRPGPTGLDPRQHPLQSLVRLPVYRHTRLLFVYQIFSNHLTCLPVNFLVLYNISLTGVRVFRLTVTDIFNECMLGENPYLCKTKKKKI